MLNSKLVSDFVLLIKHKLYQIVEDVAEAAEDDEALPAVAVRPRAGE